MCNKYSVLMKTNKEVCDALASIVLVALLLQWGMSPSLCGWLDQHFRCCALGG